MKKKRLSEQNTRESMLREFKENRGLDFQKILCGKWNNNKNKDNQTL